MAGGTGKRMLQKGKPKQFLELNGKPILIHTVEIFETHDQIDWIYIVCISEWIEYLSELIKRYQLKKVKLIIPGGTTGQESIRKGIYAIKDNENIDLKEITVLIHDGVRPLIDHETITKNIESVEKYGSAITVAPANETIIETNELNYIENVLDRDICRVARAPQSFKFNDIYEVHKKALQEGKDTMIDSAMLMKYYGFNLHCINGPIENIKITTPSDFYIFRAILESRENSQIWGL